MGLIPASVAAVTAAGTGLGLDRGIVRVVPHEARWADLVAGLVPDISSALAETDSVVEHIGSTAVPGMAAKPILDLGVGLAGSIDQDQVRSALEKIGFSFVADLGVYGGLLFTLCSQDNAETVVAHLHVVDVAGFQWRWYLRFRDGLRADHALREEYAALKTRLAEKFVGDRQGYTQAKSDWVLAAVTELDSLGITGGAADFAW